MKKQNVFMALFLAAFMLLLFGNVSSADPMMAPPGGHHEDPCMAAPAGPDRAACHATMAQQHHDPMMASAGGPIDLHGVDCAALPTPVEVTACENGPQFHDPNIMPPDQVGVGPGAPVEPPMYGGPNDHHLQAPVDMDGGHDCAAAPTPEEVAACWDAKNQHANQHHVEAADPGHHPPGMP